jgi:hypothetical protein
VEFALEWRKLYQPSLEQVRSGRRAWTVLDVLHRERGCADLVAEDFVALAERLGARHGLF